MAEVELKLELAGDADAAELGRLLGGEPEVLRQTSIYFDTPDHGWYEAGLSLRIRRENGRCTQTIKARDDAAGLFVRSEWEMAVEGDRPVPDARVMMPAALRERSAELAPLFTVENERRLWCHGAEDAAIEVSLDHGRAVAGERENRFCELELEQKAGDRAALFALARRIDATLPVRPAVLSKSERGYRLLGPLPAAVKAAPSPVTEAMNAEAAFEAIALACLKQFRLNEAPLPDRHDEEALHQARVALRRLRSALWICNGLACDALYGPLNEALRGLAAALGRARDLDALIARAGESPLLPQLRAARAEAYAAAEARLRSGDARRLQLDLVEWLAIGAWRGAADTAALRGAPARAFAAAALDRLRRKVKTRGRKLAGLDDASRHKLRKSAKKLRYAAEYFAPLYRGKREKRRYRHFLSVLERLQDALGALNDRAVTPALLENLGLSDEPGADALTDESGKTRLLAAAARARHRLLDRKTFW